MEKRKVLNVVGAEVRDAIQRRVGGPNLNTFVCPAEALDFDAMNCVSPVCLRVGKRLQFVPCGKCNFCLESRRADWSFRLHQELKVSKSANFLTLTYNDSEVPWTDNGLSLCKRDVQLFTKSLRECDRSDGWPSLRYYTVGEYGSNTLRPHYHSIMFNLHKATVARLPEIWKKGFVHVGEVSQASIHYVTGYVVNRVKGLEGKQDPFALMSKGLGKNYLESNGWWHKGDVLRSYVMHDGFKQRLPRCYRDKLFSIREKEAIAKELVSTMDEAKRLEIRELAKFHPNPDVYLFERLVQAYDRVNEEKFKANAL